MRERRNDPLPESQPAPSPTSDPNGESRTTWPEFWFEAPPAEPTPERDETRVSPTAAETAEEPRVEPAGAPARHDPAPPAQAQAPTGPAGRSRPPIAGPVEAFVRHPLLVLIPLLLLAGAGVAIGLERDPVYTAKARVNVGRADVAPFVLQSVVGGNAALAASYARVIATQKVIVGAARRSSTTPDEARERLAASPIPGSTLIQVEATGPGEADAVTLANAGSRSLIAYVTDVNVSRTTRAAFRRYRRAQADVERAQRRILALRQRGSGSEVADELSKAIVDLQAAKLRASNLANQYRASSGDPSGGSPLRLIAPAASASSDRAATLQRLILIGVAAGLVLGLGLALLVANRGRLRALRE